MNCELLNDQRPLLHYGFGFGSGPSRVSWMPVYSLGVYLCALGGVRAWVSNLFHKLHQMCLSDRPRYGPHFEKWSIRPDVSDEMSDQVRSTGREFVYHFLEGSRYRIQLYWEMILSLETINPCAPVKVQQCSSA